MNVVWAALIVVGVTACAVAALLLVRHRAPEGGYFTDGDRAAGVFGVLATGFSVLLGFLIFLAFESYDQSRVGAENEAVTVVQQVETAQLMPVAVREELTGELVCYARWVINEAWPRMEAGTFGDDLNPWGVALFETVRDVEPGSASEEMAFGKWLDQTADREVARQDRVHGAVGVIPTPLWIVLFFISAIIFVFMLFFADRGERAVVQGLLIGSVVAVISAMLLLLGFLDTPFHSDIGGLQPSAMERTLVLIDEALTAVGQDLTVPCDESGSAL
jgi:amino acid transporter